MILDDPMPDELSLGHAGRLAWLNECRSFNELYDLISSEFPHQAKASGKSALPLLATASKMHLHTYARMHSLIGLAGLNYLHPERYLSDDPRSTKRTYYTGRTANRTTAYLCVACCEEDLHTWHSSWYRRIHQIPGVDWCPKHASPLSKVTTAHPFRRVPHEWVKEDKQEQLATSVSILPVSGFLRRYTDIAVGVLDRDRSIHPFDLRRFLASQAIIRGIPSTQDRATPFLSQILLDLAPSDWIRRNVSTITPTHLWNLSSITDLLEGFYCGKRILFENVTPLLALTLIYEDADDALSDLRLLDRKDGKSADLSIQTSSVR